MSSQPPHNDVQKELEGLSPLLAGLRKQKTTADAASVDMNTLHKLGRAALDAVPVPKPLNEMEIANLQVVHRPQRWRGLIAAAVALMVGALITYSILNTSDSSQTDYVGANSALSQELMASFEAQTADPMAFLLDGESVSAEDEGLFFSPAEDVLLDWADDGTVDDELSQEVMIDALR